HPTAGACIVGARRFLVALNVNLRSQDLAIAQQIAKTIRASSGGMPYVKALGLELRSRGQVQVSMNLTGIDKTPVHVVVAEVHRLARSLGVEPAGTEIIGLLPRSVIEDAAAYHLGFENFRTELVLENRIDAVLGHLHGG
ncbi:MAG TPA: glutamate formiminotransferase, partial [Bryobacteraceae bacterium]|nr:glutamate formiminotransferase [Bryobacteraceae bacterium]